ncbi:MAG TPA: coenzyme F420-0:L-glutamate ligase [Candidatus Bathyarchaeota archaeon]|nr:coenzyme F420-0:L-glutamate ligase [Candidatus Bathyarchaeota archaeon]
MTPKTVTIIGLENFPLVKAGDNLARIIVETAAKNNVEIEDKDIIVISQKVVSKAEGRVVKFEEINPSKEAEKLAEKVQRDPKLIELVLKETRRIIKASPEILIVEDKRGLICINAGVDKSNVPRDAYSLLPQDPDESARRIKKEIEKLAGKEIAVIIVDTFSRPFRRGQVEFAIGIAGIKPFKDYRGQRDLYGNLLKVKNVAIVDEIACAAELVMGQAKEAIPVAIIKNLERAEAGEDSSIRELAISRQEDLFRETL